LNNDNTREELLEIPKRVINEISKVIVGKRKVIEGIIVAFLSEGHVLIEGYAGTAKTLTAKAFARTIGGVFKRIQFTPDTLPSDITGFYIYTITGERRFQEGPIFANIVLADEINRTTPRTQAALIEAMQEKQVTIEGVTYKLPEPFMVVATQIPMAISVGTYPLTEVQLDRFMFRLWSDYSPPEEEEKIVSNIDYIEKMPVNQVATPAQILKLINYIKENIYVDKNIVKYIVNLVTYIRKHPDVALGPSHRAGISLFKAARTYAFISGRNYVIPDDVKYFAHEVLVHRVKLKTEAEMEGITAEDIVKEALKTVEVPKI